jgi:hypothetical protein
MRRNAADAAAAVTLQLSGADDFSVHALLSGLKEVAYTRYEPDNASDLLSPQLSNQPPGVCSSDQHLIEC